ncbi:hypothetical protein Dsin_018911 [Dipteronia sinensis]|uniref:RNase H type-1 domain-containing protein n=1 Tax=Dipteronia sinensis TaxID=43782 RepID=A0AAE0E290_9ROSI|nr:hypothetical protein Dsin_018911 [Dipteronia sinensis]
MLDDNAGASGQLLNFEKSALYVSNSMGKADGSRLASINGVQWVKCHERWIPRPYSFKIFSHRAFGDLTTANTDATVCEATKKIGIGIIVRNHKGEVLGSSTRNMDACFSPQLAEAIAILRDIRFVIEFSLFPVIIESDAKQVVDLINLGKASAADVWTVINDILFLVKDFPISIVLTGRNANCAAHSLAKLALSLSDDQFLLETCHPSVDGLIYAHCNG